MKSLPPKQKLLLEYVIDFIRSEGYPPSVREISDYMGISHSNGVLCHLRALEKKGYLTRKERASRSIKVKLNVDGENLRFDIVQNTEECSLEELKKLREENAKLRGQSCLSWECESRKRKF